MNALALQLDYDGRPVAVRVEGDDNLVCAAHVCAVLDIENVSQAVKQIPEQDRTLCFDEGGPPAGRWFLREAGVNRLVVRSNKPEARRVQDWLFREVMPSIRKTGRYQAEPEDPGVELVRQMMQGFTSMMEVVSRLPGMVDESVRRRMVEGLVPVQDTLGEVLGIVTDTRAAVAALPVPRVDFVAEVERKMCRTVLLRYGRLCPRCGEREIVDVDGNRLKNLHIDHWSTRGSGAPENGWAICIPCHNLMGPAGSRIREQFKAEFVTFQNRMAMLPAEVKPETPEQKEARQRKERIAAARAGRADWLAPKKA